MTDGRPRLLVGTPTANGIVSSAYVSSLMSMTERLRAGGIAVTYRLVDGPNLAIQRDALAEHFISSDCTHLLLIDRDMSFAPGLAETLLGAGKPLVGVIPPRSAPDLDRLRRHLETRSFDAALALAHEWEVELIDGQVTVENGFCRVRAVGTRFLLVARTCLEEVARRSDLPTYEFDGPGHVLRAFFRPVLTDGLAGPAGDLAFCRDYHDGGGEVWAYTGARVGPVGERHYGMPFTRFLDAHSAAGATAHQAISAIAPDRRT